MASVVRPQSEESLRGLGDLPLNEVTRILNAIEKGDPSAAHELLPMVYEELRRLAAQKLAQEPESRYYNLLRTGLEEGAA